MIVEQVHRRTTIGNYILQNIEDMVLETGLYAPLWSMPFNIIKVYVATHSLIFHAIECNFTNDISISVTHGELHPQRRGYPYNAISFNVFFKETRHQISSKDHDVPGSDKC